MKTSARKRADVFFSEPKQKLLGRLVENPIYPTLCENPQKSWNLFVGIQWDSQSFFAAKISATETNSEAMISYSQIPSKIEWELTNGPLSCDRAIRYSGFFGVRETWILLEISWTDTYKSFSLDSCSTLGFLLYSQILKPGLRIPSHQTYRLMSSSQKKVTYP